MSEDRVSEPLPLRRKSEGRLELVDVSALVESPWNPNEMNEETFDALVEDMRVGGVFSIKAIDVFPIGLDDRGLPKLQIADGHNRYRGAKKLGWKRMRAEVLNINEDEAKVLNFTRNRERGTLNPVKEGALFFNDWEKGKGKMTQEQIAEKYRVSQPYVSNRIATLPLYSVGIKPTHAEEISHTVKQPEAQVAVARAAVKHKLTPDETREVAQTVEREVKRLPDAPPKFFEEKADEAAREIKREDRGGNEVEIETITCDECDADFKVFHIGPNKHRIVKVT